MGVKTMSNMVDDMELKAFLGRVVGASYTHS